MKFVKNHIFLKKLIRDLKSKFKFVYKIDYYGSYHLDITNLVIVIVFKTEEQLLNCKREGKINSITLFCNTYLEHDANILFISNEFIKKNFDGSYWNYYKSL
jgi:hypothetical protein